MKQGGTMSELSLSQAAKITGKSKSTINRAIKSGKLSATRHDDGTYSIDAAELHRAFPLGTSGGAEWIAAKPGGTTNETDRLRIESLEAALNREREVNADLMADRDHWRQQAKALLAAPPKLRSWWPWK
jgi:excisionase family DNA binding protein